MLIETPTLLRSPAFEKLTGIQHGFFTRQGGVSDGLYTSLNCALKSQDHPARIHHNRRRAMECIGRAPTSLVTVKNVHGKEVVVVKQPDEKWLQVEADALVTCNPEVTLGSYNADCPLILFADSVHKVIGVSHAGWRGAKAGVAEATVAQMQALGAQLDTLHAVIGPCLQQAHFEVSHEFYASFLEDKTTNAAFFTPGIKPLHYQFDLQAYLLTTLKRMGVVHCSALNMDTYSNEALFYSYRRSFHRQEADFGCQLAVLYLEAS